jgi:cyclohexa-1,5-dienecarbonyl-CoA hydratase
VSVETVPACGPVRVEREADGALRRVVLTGGRGNVLDRAMVDALAEVARDVRDDPRVKAVVLEGAGAHFCYGASVAEHLPGEVAGMLARFHALFGRLLEGDVVWLAAVRGRCLGGGLELAAFCHRVFAAPDAVLGQPEVALGVFAPVASAFLPERVGRAAAEDLCLTGRTVGAAEALAMGLVDEVADHPAAAALAWARTHLLPRSASSLRHAVRAVRWDLARDFPRRLAELERFYLDRLMATEDAVEGLRAFLEKRPATWRDR